MLQKAPMYAYIPAKDVARARKFYEEKVGLKPGEETAGGVTYHFGNGTACFLYPTPNAGTSTASQAFWQVDDVEREVRELKTLDGIMTAGDGKAAWFKDSEGNILALIQSL
jgi:predicted enzyme related to lactoylglutathione lyase